MKTKYLLSFLSFFVFFSSYSQQLNIELFGPVFDKPVNIKHAGDDRLFIVEQDGYIQILNSNGTKNATPFLDIEALVVDISGIGDERGFLGLAFHPDYSNNGYFFVNYINLDGDTVISRFKRNDSNPNLADINSECIVLTFTQPAINHNGGDMAFGPDGMLYISSGDGGGVGDPSNNAQSLTTLLGKMLRLDVSVNDPNTCTYNTTGNPFPNAENPTALPEIWAFGLRNPWKFTFDKNNGDLWIADVGQSNKEEINRVASTASGLNYGWRCFEGTATFDTSSGCPEQSSTVTPVSEYDYGASGGNPFRCAITGGYRYRGIDFSANFGGLYFFADYCSNEIGYLTPNQNETAWSATYFEPDTQTDNDSWVAFGEDNDGELYISGIVTGRIYKIIDESLSNENFETNDFKIHPNPASKNFIIKTANVISNGNLNIYNILGKRVKTLNFNGSSIQIDIANINRGIYIVELTDSKGSKQTKKLILN